MGEVFLESSTWSPVVRADTVSWELGLWKHQQDSPRACVIFLTESEIPPFYFCMLSSNSMDPFSCTAYPSCIINPFAILFALLITHGKVDLSDKLIASLPLLRKGELLIYTNPR